MTQKGRQRRLEYHPLPSQTLVHPSYDSMKPALIIVGSVVLAVLFTSVFQFAKDRSTGASVQLVGAVCLGAVIFFHVAEAYRLIPSMGWGLPHSPGHYLDLWSAVAGLILCSTGYVFRKVTRTR